ncbi:TIGR01459 family HAD-type hydrolase [Aureimonas leprariae]|uniref:TIGR01459 family HAD-type hydrolase n=1 Tax=Plantimonas leprariae TaxID=2615207 RepID=A0A7V7PSU1_9HYPH|nr:TIGR01459 family HAD-type hydrolase [Aureimonas leprariae]KAB0682608.1 TIGR01459 family HAD-type hydrolase [Aureimonas leprariae]
MTAPEAIADLGTVVPRYEAIFCDVWGVIHDGVEKHAAAEAALRQARQAGRTVVLLTNSPRPLEGVARQLDSLSFSREAYDRIVTSGDVTRDLIASGPRRLFHIGPERNKDIFTGIEVDFVGEAEAETIVATGLFDDETETPDDYAELLARLRERNLPMVCANPDVVVHRGAKLIFCAGALAKAYGAEGGAVAMAGKPYRPIYDLAAREAGTAGRPTAVLAIGDGLHTDIRGANDYGVDVLLIAEGVHRDELGAGIGEALGAQGLAARYVMPTLR